ETLGEDPDLTRGPYVLALFPGPRGSVNPLPARLAEVRGPDGKPRRVLRRCGGTGWPRRCRAGLVLALSPGACAPELALLCQIPDNRRYTATDGRARGVLSQGPGRASIMSFVRRTRGPGKHGYLRGGIRSREYQIWSSMIQRCCNPTCREFKYY